MKEAHGRMEREVIDITNQMRESKNREREVLQGERELREEVRVKALKIEELSNQLKTSEHDLKRLESRFNESYLECKSLKQ